MSYIIRVAAILIQCTRVLAVTYNWELSWVERNPDGRQLRPVIGINGQWPLPIVEAQVGEQIIVNLKNSLVNETAGLHFHGLFQQGSNAMDGPSMLTQCPLAPGLSVQYQFTVNQPGTYWYHSHNKGQYPDGFRGPVLIHDPNSPYKGQYDSEFSLTVTDWYHNQMPALLPSFLSVTQNPDGSEPIPHSGLLNDATTTNFNLVPGKTYLIRIINMGDLASWYIHFDQHEMTIVEVDGVYTQKQVTDQIYLTSGQRMSVLITAKSDASKNFAFIGAMDPDMFDSTPPCLQINNTGYLIYDAKAPLPPQPVLDTFEPFDDFGLAPVDQTALLGPVNHQIVLNIVFTPAFGQNRVLMNNLTYVPQNVPTLMTVLSAGKDATNPLIYGANSIPQILNHNDIVEVVVNNFDDGGHPIHMHGHNFQMVERPQAGAGVYSGSTKNPPAVPIRRDVIKVNGNSYLVYRFKADNPGVWAFHCHIDWHLEGGFFATFIEAPLELQSQTIPADQMANCKAQGIPTAGNAAGNTKTFLDVAGAPTAPPTTNQGALVRRRSAKVPSHY